MKNTSLALTAMSMALLATTPAQAQKRTMFITVEELSRDCAGDQQFCVGFIAGIADALEATAWPAKRSCRGNEVLLSEVLELAAELLVEPAVNKADGPAFDYLATEFIKTWPC